MNMDQIANASESDRPEGRYANYFESGHNAFEFILDFGQFHEANGKPIIHTRIITGPMYAKAFNKTLQNAIAEYEKVYGCIDNLAEESNENR